jgi:hypothetical protein
MKKDAHDDPGKKNKLKTTHIFMKEDIEKLSVNYYLQFVYIYTT